MSLTTITIATTGTAVRLRDLSVLRQAFVIAGGMVLGGVALAVWVHTYFIALPLLVGAGLLFSGVVGVCPMVLLLNLAPWNRSSHN